MVKWLSVPFSILVLVASTGTLNLYKRWETVVLLQGYTSSTLPWVMYAVLLGYLGSFPGLYVHYMGKGMSFVLSAVLVLIGYIGLGIASTWNQGGTFLIIFTLLFLFLAALGSSIAIVSAVSTPVGNFTRRGAILMIVLMLVYFKIGPVFEASLRKGTLTGIDKSVYYPCYGIFLAILYAIAVFLIKEIDIDDRYEKAFNDIDQAGILVFILIQAILAGSIYVTFIVYVKFWLTLIIFSVFLLINFIAIMLITKMAKDR